MPLRGHTEEKSNFIATVKTIAKSDEVLAMHLETATLVKYTSPDIQNELIDICADQILDQLKESCSNSPCLAILADETTDKATQTQLSVCFRFTETIDNEVNVRGLFLGFMHAKATTGEAIANLLLEFMNKHGICLQKLRAQGYGGASNMSGRHNGVQALTRNHAPDAVYVHCKAHCLNLAIVHSCKEPVVRTMMATVQEIAFAFEYSAKRLKAFSEELTGNAVVREAVDKQTKLKKLCETRWFSRSDALTTFKHAFPVVVDSLEHLRNNRDDKAWMFRAAILRFDFIVCLVVCQHILNCSSVIFSTGYIL
ncbi:zinc finger MYM-type protein 1-like [Mytilus trossulus]|uniref:zinc finger MYM-type protein 1-like n=1 Tax=Mytilus trossulus TaxID=6551 RepID=UPI00300660E5